MDHGGDCCACFSIKLMKMIWSEELFLNLLERRIWGNSFYIADKYIWKCKNDRGDCCGSCINAKVCRYHVNRKWTDVLIQFAT